ncbi:MAG: sodium:solute symporter [Chitinophagaceae bacterium]|nr:MAG: sodium:solute symporter [Chitinophagaceae bacterium]
MTQVDWIIMLGTLFFIVGYGIWKTRGQKNIGGFLKGDNQDRWWVIGLSVMATQASAITFLSTPGQGYEDGMRFLQFYFGLPLAMIIIAVVFIPLYYRLKVYTAYEFLERRFDRKTRVFTAMLFLLQRGLAAGITIYAPAIILSQIIGWSLSFTVIFIGVLVILYTVTGGTKAVTQTHKQQMAVIFTGMFIAFGVLIWHLSEYASFGESLQLAGKMGRMNIIDLEFDLSNRYNIWSGLIGGLFLQLAYFGTDQSQVQRYLSGSSVKQSRMGLMFNGLMKIPMQFFILITGVLVFVLFQFEKEPLHFNNVASTYMEQSASKEEWQALQGEYQMMWEEKKSQSQTMLQLLSSGDEAAINQQQELLLQSLEKRSELKNRATEVIAETNPSLETRDHDYIFITYIMNYLPIGLVGLLLAVIFSAAMSSTSAELNALASTTTVDMYKRNFKQEGSEKHFLNASKIFTLIFGLLAIGFALTASLFENLIQAVNILGSLFYGTILGIFIVAFFMRKIRGHAVFIAAIFAEIAVITIYLLQRAEILHIEYLWLNLIGCGLVMIFSFMLQAVLPKKQLQQ